MDLCKISLSVNCIMQLKQFYNIATKVNSRKSATTFGDLPDWSGSEFRTQVVKFHRRWNYSWRANNATINDMITKGLTIQAPSLFFFFFFWGGGYPYIITTMHPVHDDVIKWKHLSHYCHLYGEFTGHRWMPHTKASDVELWCFLWSAPE